MNQLPQNVSKLIDEKYIQKKNQELADKLNVDYAEKDIVVLTIMNGGMIFASDLCKMLNLNFVMDFVQVSRYDKSFKGGGLVWKHKCETDLKDKHVIIMDDIYDEGFTMEAVDKWCREQGASSVASVACIKKQHKRKKADYQLSYYSIEIADLFIFGYGMDLEERLRHLRDIHYVEF